MSNFRAINRPPSVDEWLPERHLARFRITSRQGRKLHALRKQTPEPVFGSIKAARWAFGNFCC